MFQHQKRIKSARTRDVTIKIKISHEDMKTVNGKDSHTIKTINNLYNVRSFTRIDRDDPKETAVISITGYGSNVAAAKKHILNIVDESMRRRGLPVDAMKEICVLKKKENDNVIEKIVKMYFAPHRNVKSNDECHNMRNMVNNAAIQTSDNMKLAVEHFIPPFYTKQEKYEMIEKIAKFYFNNDIEIRKDWYRIRHMLEWSDKTLMKRVDDAVRAEIDAIRPCN